MIATHVSVPAIDKAIREVCSALDEKAYEPPSWAMLTEDDLWRELVACILGSRVRFEVAHSAVERIEKMGLLCQERRSSRFDEYEQDVLDALSGKALAGNRANKYNWYPFYRIRANQIRRAAERLYGSRDSVREFLHDASDIREARRRLTSEVSGFGPKQASLFLRNIGYADRVAVLDVHVLTYMSWVGLTDTPLKSVSTIRKYETLEDSFIAHSHSFGYTPDRFDLAVWVVVKVAKEEYKSWG